MGSFLKILLPVVALLAMAVLGYGMTLDTTWQVERSVLIDAPAAAVHPHVERPRSWEGWAAREMAATEGVTLSYAGPEAGVGASYAWDSPGSNGRMTLTASDPETGIAYRMSLEDGRSEASGTIRYTPEAGGTRVTWTDAGDLGMAPFGGFMVGWMEKSLGAHFEKGLAELEQVVESSPPPEPPAEAPAEPPAGG